MSILTPRTDTIPQPLKDRNQWVVWKAEPKANGRVDKLPVNARTGNFASTTDPDTWSSFDEAVKEYTRNPDRYAGIGYVFDVEDPCSGVDLDDCIDEHGAIADWAQEIIGNFDTYAEVSPGGKGVKIFCIGDIPSNATRTPIELYDYARFFTITGHHLPQTPRDIRDANDALQALHARIKPPEDDAPPRPRVSLATEKTDFLQRWADTVATRATRMVAQAQEREKHTMRLKAAKLWAGLIPHNLATAEQIESVLFHAQKPKDHAHKERKAIQDAIKYGESEPLDLPPEPAQPIFDEQDFACCPSGHGRLRQARNKNGWLCPVVGFDCIWWKGEGYTLPEVRAITQESVASTPKLIHASNLKSLPPSEWLIDGLLPTNKLVELFGMPGHGKSFTALDIALSVAQFANVIYIAAEDAEDYQVRVDAWCEHHHAQAGGLYFWPEAVNLFNQASIDAFLAEARPIQPTLIVIDPLANCMTGGDESSTKDMTIAVDHLNYIRRQTQAAILINHHTGWNDAHERGSSVLRGACRVVAKLSNNDGLLTLTCEKINGAKAFDPRYFKLVPTGTSAVPVPTTKLSDRDAAITPKHIDILDALNLSIFADGASFTQLVEHLNAPKSSMNRYLSKLVDLGYIAQDGKGHMKRYTLTGSGIDTLLAAHGEKVPSKVPPTPDSGTREWNFVELSLNWVVKKEAIRPPKFHPDMAPQSQSSTEFQTVPQKFHQPTESSVPPPSLKGVEQRNNGMEQGTDEAQEETPPPAPTTSANGNGHAQPSAAPKLVADWRYKANAKQGDAQSNTSPGGIQVGTFLIDMPPAAWDACSTAYARGGKDWEDCASALVRDGYQLSEIEPALQLATAQEATR